MFHRYCMIGNIDLDFKRVRQNPEEVRNTTQNDMVKWWTINWIWLLPSHKVGHCTLNHEETFRATWTPSPPPSPVLTRFILNLPKSSKESLNGNWLRTKWIRWIRCWIGHIFRWDRRPKDPKSCKISPIVFQSYLTSDACENIWLIIHFHKFILIR